MKLKDILKLKLIKWLEIDRIENKLNDEVKYNIKNFNNHLNFIKSNTQAINNNSKSINILHSTIENVVHIGTDVRENRYNDTHSWAVICIEGKINIVKFVDLNRQDAREILNFLKHFEGGRHCVDSPSPLLFDQLFKL